MITFFFALTGLSTIGGAALLILTLMSSQSAPQQAAGAAISIGLAVIPYVFGRCVQIVISETHRREESKRLIEKLDAIERAVATQAPNGFEVPPLVRVKGEIS